MKLHVRGHYKVWHNKRLIAQGRNLVVQSGLNLFATLISGSGDAPSHMAIGASNAVPTLPQTALQGTEHERVAASLTVAQNGLTLEAAFGTGVISDVTLGEFGIFNAAAAGTMIARWALAQTVTFAAADDLDVIWALTLEND